MVAARSHGHTVKSQLPWSRQDMRTSQSVAAMIIGGAVLITIGILAGGAFNFVALGAALLFAAGLFQTIDNRRSTQ